ncbi:MAG: hypothetical protein KQI62_11105 [Deltaproteobacteria bacterium]|nr:hypothetical protein [Deltaproteobacteria bacterium]
MTLSPRREAQLSDQGWRRQFMADEPRLSEAVAEYLALGFQVHLEPIDPTACAGGPECAACFATPETAARFKIIFTRPAAEDTKG